MVEYNMEKLSTIETASPPPADKKTDAPAPDCGCDNPDQKKGNFWSKTINIAAYPLSAIVGIKVWRTVIRGEAYKNLYRAHEFDDLKIIEHNEFNRIDLLRNE